jgi:hypothetical protein
MVVATSATPPQLSVAGKVHITRPFPPFETWEFDTGTTFTHTFYSTRTVRGELIEIFDRVVVSALGFKDFVLEEGGVFR